jgi:glyoxylase-like metal-dependent hydrolase (beta-lactamase superfamily II)
MNKRTGLILGTAMALALPLWQPARSQEPALATESAARNTSAAEGQLHPWHVQGNVWLIGGEPGGSNVTVQVGSDGVLVIDTGVQALAPELLRDINALAHQQGFHSRGKALKIIIDTGGAADHVGGNAVLREGGETLLAGNAANDQSFNPGAAVWADEHVQSRMIAPGADGKPSVDISLWPNQTRIEDLYSLMYDGEAVQLLHPHQAVSDGDIIVLFRGSNVIASGDVLTMASYPVIDVKHGGTIDGELVALNRLLELTVPGPYEEGGTLIIPGHGHICDQGDLVAYRNMITQIRNRVQFYKNEGKSLAQVLALKPSADTDYRWGKDQGPWTTQQFIEAIYTTLPKKGPNFSMQQRIVVPADAGAGTHGEETF